MFIALYVRVSTTRQADNDLSIPDQLRQLRIWAENQGHQIVREYVEPGASATDDKRPVFRQMIADAGLKPTPFQMIAVYKSSRFYRDLVGSELHKRQLEKKGIRVVAITQPTSDDAAGDMIRQVFSMFDGYQSRETSDHTHRAMCQNARMGYSTASIPSFGFRNVPTEVCGARGRKKKRLEIDDVEASTVRDIYRWYQCGLDGRTVGIKEIVKYLNEQGQLMRGRPWSIQKLHTVLSSRAYLGEHLFNVKEVKTGRIRPPEEWILVKSDPIIDAATFERVRELREQRSPTKTHPRVTSSPALLSGVISCECGAAMTQATGKSGRYHYYKCSARMTKAGTHCKSRNLPMEKFDDVVLRTLADRIFTPDRLNVMMGELRKTVRDSRETGQEHVNELNRQAKAAEVRLNRLYEAVEKGLLPMDETLKKRSDQLRTARDALLIEVTNARQEMLAPVVQVLPSMVDTFSRGIRRKLQDKDFAKRYLQLLVDKIVVSEDVVTISGDKAKLASAIHAYKKKGTSEEVPSFMRSWRARSDSNALPLGS